MPSYYVLYIIYTILGTFYRNTAHTEKQSKLNIMLKEKKKHKKILYSNKKNKANEK